MSAKLKIRRFPIDKMKPNRTILLCGRRGMGKSTLLKDILYHIRKRVDTGFAFSPTQDTIRMFEDCFPHSHIYNEYSLDVVKNIIASLTSLTEQNKHREVVLTLDDCMFDKGIMKTREMREIHMNGRHLHLWFINCVQYLMDMGPDIRSQIDYVFVLKENVIANRQKLHKYFFGIFEKYEEFSLVMDKCTNSFECLVLDNTQANNSIEDSIYYYKADPNIGRFRLGKSIYFKLDHYFRRRDDKNQRSLSDKTKLPDPVQPKKRIQQVEKADEPEQNQKKHSPSPSPSRHQIHNHRQTHNHHHNHNITRRTR